jgi:hypothetical protein
MRGEAERTDKNWCSIHNTNNITANSLFHFPSMKRV